MEKALKYLERVRMRKRILHGGRWEFARVGVGIARVEGEKRRGNLSVCPGVGKVMHKNGQKFGFSWKKGCFLPQMCANTVENGG